MRGWCVFLCWCVAFGSALAQERAGELPIGQDESYLLSPHFMFFEDKSAKLTFDDILRPETQAAFRPVPHAGPGMNFGFTSSAIWLRITLKSAAATPADWLLELSYAPLDRLELYAPDGESGIQRQRAGDKLDFASRVVAHRNHVLPVWLAPGLDSTLYLRLESEGTVTAPVRLWRPAAMWKNDQLSYAALSLYFGLLAGLLLYNLLLFISVREITYLVYVGFAASMSIGQVALTGLGGQFLWPEWTWWNGVAPMAGLSAAAIFAVQYARSFLGSRIRMPKADRFLCVQLAGWGLTLLACLIVSYTAAVWMVTVMAMVSVASMVVLGVLGLRGGQAGARAFVLAWAVLTLGVVTLALHNAGVLPSNVFTGNSLLIASALEMVLLSFALGDRINVARRFKEQARARIAAEHAMVEALGQSQAQLRTALQEREIILESSIVGIVFLTPEGRFRWANKAMYAIFGIQGRFGGSMEPIYLSRADYLRVGSEVGAAVARGEAYETELQMRRADGTPIWVSLSGRAVNRQDLKQGTVWVISNINERRLLEEQLRKASAEREAILDSAMVGIVLSTGRRHVWVNEKFAQMVGYPREALIGMSSSQMHPDEEDWERLGMQTRAALIENGSHVCERQLKHRNGELFWVEMGGSCLHPNDPDAGVIWTFLDITQRKKLEAEIRASIEQQERQSSSAAASSA